MFQMPKLEGQLREAVLFRIQDVKRHLDEIEEILCLSEEEERMFDKQQKKINKPKKEKK